MKSVRRIEMYLMEDIRTASGEYVPEFVPHNFSVEQSKEIIFEMLKALHIILSHDEMQDLAESLGKALASLVSSRETEPSVRGRLKIREVS